MTTVSDGLFQYGGVPVGMNFTGKAWFVDPANGSDGNSGKGVDNAFKTIYKAYAMCTAGQNDTVYLIGDGATTGTARLSTALAQSVTAAATTGTLTWAKNATHLTGITANTMTSQRARIAATTTETLTTFGSGNFIVVTAQGCQFSNFSVFQGFATGGASEICWTDSGGRNSYNNVCIEGGGDAGSADTTTFRSLLISGTTGENTFRNCSIGLDTTARGNKATTEIEFAGGSPRNTFANCKIKTYAKNVGATWVTIGGSGIDREVTFDNCTFFNPVLPATGAAATAMTVGMSVDAAAGGVVLVKDPLYYGAATMSTSALVFSNIAAAAAKGGLGVVAS